MTPDDPGALPRIPALEADYEMVRELGRDGPAVVYLARERTVDRPVAIKLIRSTDLEDDDSMSRLLREATAVGRLDHPNIVMLLGTRRIAEGELALILQHVPGVTVAERLQTTGALPYGEAKGILEDVAHALSYAHRRGIIHGDVCPGNIHVDQDTGRARLSGFGMARIRDGGTGASGERSDVLGLGRTGYEMLTGEAHEGTPTLGQECPGLPRPVREALEGALRTDPRERWQSADEFLAALRGSAVRDSAPGQAPIGGKAGVDRSADHRPWGSLHEEQVDTPFHSPRPPLARRIMGALEVPLLAIITLMVGLVVVHPEPTSVVEAALDHLRLPIPWADEPLDGRQVEDPWRDALGAGEADAPVGAASGLDEDGGFDLAVNSGPEGVVVVGGRSRVGAPGFPLSGPVVLRVVDEHGVGVPEVEVFFEVAAGGGTVEPSRGVTGAGGAVSTSWTLGDGEGTQVLRAGVVGNDAPELIAEVTAEAMEMDAPGALPERGPQPGEQPAPEEAEEEEGEPIEEEITTAGVEALRGADQEGAPGEALPGALEVRVRDTEGRPLPGVAVNFRVTDGGGSVSPSSPATDGDGIARATWTLGPEEGPQRVQAHLEGAPSAATEFSARIASLRLPIRSAVAAGGTHSCLLRSDGSLSCWGANDGGQLGDGSGSRSLTPGSSVDGEPFAAVAAGVSHTCALSLRGRLLCWGRNDSGQLGDGGSTSRSSPIQLSEAPAFVSVSAGGSHTCALTRDGAAWCWGANDQGQLGDGSNETRRAPVRVDSPVAFRQIVAGWRHSCALDQGGHAYCWGSNDSGEAGLVTGRLSRIPRAVLGGHQFQAIAAGNAHTCGLTEGGRILCWGANGSGQLGDGTRGSRPTPTPIAHSGSFVGVTAGGIHTCGLDSDGRVHCWGGNVYGQIGDGTTTERPRPVAVGGGARFVQIHALGSHTCGRTDGDEVRCWGYNLEGQLGDGTRENRNVPTGVNR